MKQPKTYALLGAAGFVAPRHMRAIKETGGTLVAACDPHDSVGVLDSYFPEARFFTEFERFDRHLEKLRRRGEGIDYLVVASPNYLHDAHCRLGLRLGASVICEKPLVVNPWNLDQLAELETEHGGRVYTILQLRLLPALQALRALYEVDPRAGAHEVELTYVTRRGAWYHQSWKGDEARSGGLLMNIGVHFFDVLVWLFGGGRVVEAAGRHDKAAGVLELDRARVSWMLSVDPLDLPEPTEQTAYRVLKVDGREVDFTSGLEALHTRQYEEILAGRGVGIAEARPAIEIVHSVRGAIGAEMRGAAVRHRCHTSWIGWTKEDIEQEMEPWERKAIR